MFSIEDHGTIWLIQPHDIKVASWLRQNVDPEAQWFGTALAVEPRYVEAIATALIEEGYALQ
jgi:hypothetical protein